MERYRSQILILIESPEFEEVTYFLVVPFSNLNKATMNAMRLLIIETMV